MKLGKKIRAIVALAVLALISVVGVACGQTVATPQEFKFTKEIPAEVLYGSELYFRDYLPREFGNEYELYASYYNVDEQKEVVEELNTSLAYSFNYVSDYKFKIVRNGKDTLECTIKSMPEAPSIIENALLDQKARPTNEQNFDRLLIMVFGGEPLNNNEKATADPDYEIKATAASFQSVEIEGSDVEKIDISKGKITFDRIGYYSITYTATNRAGTDSEIVTVRTAAAENHIDKLTGYLKENGEGKDDNQLVFDMDIMKAPADGESVRVRYGAGKGAQSDIYDAVYDAYTGKYTIDNFAHELTKEDQNRLFLEDADGELYSTLVTLPTIITQESIDKAGSAASLYNATEGYILLGSDIDLKKYPFASSTVFTGVLDGNGYSIKNIKGPQTVDSYGAKRDTGASLFYNVLNATIKNLTLDGVYANTGMLTQRVEGACEFKNIVARLVGYQGARTSLLGYHAEDMDTSTVRNVIIEMPVYDPEKTGYVGMLTTHAGGKTIIENLFLVGGVGRLHSTVGNNTTFVPKHYTDRADSVDGFAEQGKDYFVGESAEVVYKGTKNGTVSDFMLTMVEKANMVVGLDVSNIGILQTATSGYFYLKEDIDMAGIEHVPTQAKGCEFTATLDGAGHKIINFTATKGHVGLVGWTGKGATFKNIDIHMVTNTTKGGLIGQVHGVTTFDNVNVTVDKLDVNLGGVITSVVQGELKVKDTNIIIKGVAGTKNGAGFIAAGEANSYNVTVENVKVVDLSNAVDIPYKGYSNTVANGKVKVDNVTLGADGELAVLGEDYFYVGGDILDFDVDTIENEDFKAFVKDVVKDLEEDVVFLSNENFSSLIGATTGYYVLAEDIDLSKVDCNGDEDGLGSWIPTDDYFTGTLNGKGYTIYNFTVKTHATRGLFANISTGAIIKNLNMVDATITNNNNALISGNIRGSVTIENCIFDLSSFASYASGIITRSLATADPIYIKDVTIIVNDSAMSASNNLLFGNYTGLKNEKVTVDGLHIFDLATASNKITTLYNSSITMVGADGETAVLGEDYHMYVGEFPYIDLAKIQDAEIKAYMTDKFNKEITVLTQDNFTQLQTATAGYYLLGEDIDMSGVAWVPTATFVGTLDGRGHKIYNFTGPSGRYQGLFNVGGAKAKIKNLQLHMISNTIGGGIFGQVKGAVTIENSSVIVDKFAGAASGAIANVVQGDITLNNVVVRVIDAADSAYVIAGNEAGTRKVALNNVVVVMDNGTATLYPEKGSSNATMGITGEEGVDYQFVKDVFDADASKLSGLAKSVLEEMQSDVVYLNNKNITQLQTATGGYYILEEDIDLKDVSWAGTVAARNLTLNGKGHKIENIKLTGSNYQAFFQNFGGVIKNVSFNFASMAGNYKGLIGQIRAGTVIENVVLDYDNFSGNSSGAIAAMSDKASSVTLNNVLINFDNVTKGTNAGILMGVYNEAGRKVTMNGVIIHNKNADLNQLVAITDQKYAATITGTEGTDYFMVTDILDADSSKLSGLAKSTLESMQAEILKSVIVLTEENIDLLQTATTGYYILGEDIDMAGKTWAPTQTSSGKYFTATLNGGGYQIKNFTAPAGYLGLVGYTGAGATFKNLKIHIITNTTKGAIIGQVKGLTTVENCVIDIDTMIENHAGGIADVVQGTLNVNNVLINVDTATHNYGVGFVAGREAASANVIVSNCFFVSGDGQISNVFAGDNEDKTALKETTLGADGQLAVVGEDYVVVSKLSDIDRNKLTTDLLKSGYDALIG